VFEEEEKFRYEKLVEIFSKCNLVLRTWWYLRRYTKCPNSRRRHCFSSRERKHISAHVRINVC